MTVETEIAALDTLTLEQTYMATVSADSSASVYPKVNAVVSSLNVEVGDTVKAPVMCSAALRIPTAWASARPRRS